MDAQVRSDLGEWLAVYGCVRALAAAVVAATVAVEDTADLPGPRRLYRPRLVYRRLFERLSLTRPARS